jgi:hypothetical protein
VTLKTSKNIKGKPILTKLLPKPGRPPLLLGSGAVVLAVLLVSLKLHVKAFIIAGKLSNNKHNTIEPIHIPNTTISLKSILNIIITLLFPMLSK